MKRSISVAELRQWEAYWCMEPWGATRDNMHAGIVAAMLANQNRKRGSKAFSFKDFMLQPAVEHFGNQRKRFMATLRALAKPKGA